MYLGATDPKVKKRQNVEKRIVLALVNELLEQGFSLSVFDGEEESVETTELAAVKKAIMETDEDYLLVHKDGKELGWFKLVYGNDGYDVLSDYTVNMEPFMTKTRVLIDNEEIKFERRQSR